MFSIRKLLDIRINRERTRALERIFNTSHKELRHTYSVAPDGFLNAKPPMFPGTQYLGDIDIKASVTTLQVEQQQKAIVESAIEACGFVSVRPGNYVGNNARYDIRKVRLAVANSFGGVVVSLLSNDVDVFWKLRDARLNPPPPWIAFPDIDPDSLGSLQGDIEYWWASFWTPFWDVLDSAQKDKFLHDHDATFAWRECIFAHSSARSVE
ncbi:hypothetical protein B0G84_4303 [Paraburkholderia sp. BL8N3]|nr:hypothetical protein [Paraburkholderia sp. BL8N3]TCK38977.1 hypothetical protein B0G84_4303 [Paraburkholderia sp. BL8N3]